MRLVSTWKRCSKCGGMYAYNPDSGCFPGRSLCPNCRWKKDKDVIRGLAEILSGRKKQR